jgi:aerobic-type carbon monoxide dehydrogenase small subunit (CoxS/CutS family)
MSITSDAHGPIERVALVLNGERRSEDVEPRTLLSGHLRDACGLTGTHVGCEHGVCGACTVLVDGNAVRSCLMLAVQVDGAEVETVESLTVAGRLDPVQQAFQDSHGLQCGFCTPGILMAVTAARRRGAALDEVMTEVLGGHLCRCTGYAGIRAAVRRVWVSGNGAVGSAEGAAS